MCIRDSPNNGLLDINQGTDISLTITGGDFTADKSTETDIVINHANIGRTNTTTTATPAHGGTFTAVDSITTSSTGHITAVNTKTVTIPNESNPTVNNGTLTINTAGIASGSGTFTANQAGNSTITITASEADTLATVTGRGASTSTESIFTGNLRARKSQTAGNYTTAALWTESFSSTATGVAFHISGNVGKFLEMRTNGTLYWDGGTVWHSGNDGTGTGLDADKLDNMQPTCLLYTSPSPRDLSTSRMPSSA